MELLLLQNVMKPSKPKSSCNSIFGVTGSKTLDSWVREKQFTSPMAMVLNNPMFKHNLVATQEPSKLPTTPSTD